MALLNLFNHHWHIFMLRQRHLPLLHSVYNLVSRRLPLVLRYLSATGDALGECLRDDDLYHRLLRDVVGIVGQDYMVLVQVGV